MSDQRSTELDLRSALQSLVPEDLDVPGFRARLDVLLAKASTAASADGDIADGDIAGADIVPLTSDPDWAAPRRRRLSRSALAVTTAACIAALLAVALAFLPILQSGRHDPLAADGPSLPAAIRTTLLPGTIVLHTYSGQGSQTFSVEPHVIPEHFDYSVYGTCKGTGALRIGPGFDLPSCKGDNGSGFGYGPGVVDGRLVITASARVSWQITLVIEPDIQSNGGVQHPVDEDMTGPDTGFRQSGSGSGTARFTGVSPLSAPGTTYRLRLVCHGSGVALPDLKADRSNGLMTKTCFSGFEYAWTTVRLTLPAVTRVVAAPGTTWTIVILSG